MLAIDVQVVLRNLVRMELPVLGILSDSAVDDEMRDVNVLWSQFPRHALREPAQRELAHGEGRRLRVALHARRSAGEEDGAGAALEHALRRRLRHQKAGVGRDLEGLAYFFTVER